jgi:hypothetical protein
VTDRDRVLQLLLMDHLDQLALTELGRIVDRNHNDGEFAEWTWLALRDWFRCVTAARLARRTAMDAVRGEDKP